MLFIKREEYERLVDCERLKNELEKEVGRLAELVSAEVKDCKIGPWCKKCGHFGHDVSVIYDPAWMGAFVKVSGGEVAYCRKHLHEICPEFENKGRESV